MLLNQVTVEHPEALQGKTPGANTPKAESSGKSFSKILEKEQAKTNTNSKKQEKPEKDKPQASDKKDDTRKELHKTIKQAGEDLGEIFRFLYDLVYRDPSQWSLADKQHYGIKDTSVTLQEFGQMLEQRGLSLQDLGYERFTQLTRLSTRSQLSTFLDKLMQEMDAAANTKQSAKAKEPFADMKTSLQEAQKQTGATENQIVKEVLKHIALRKIREGTEMNITLDPKEFGELTLGLVLSAGTITAHFKTNNSSVKQALDNHLNELASAFHRQGLSVKSLEVEKIS